MCEKIGNDELVCNHSRAMLKSLGKLFSGCLLFIFDFCAANVKNTRHNGSREMTDPIVYFG